MSLGKTFKVIGNKNWQHSSDDNEEETLSLLSKKFSKFLKKNTSKNHTNDRYVSKEPTFNSNKYTCFGCGDQRHIKFECPSKEIKEKKSNKKFEKKGK